jgi:uncharacterized SAM-binding protein YcdF (DUF218 family)
LPRDDVAEKPVWSRAHTLSTERTKARWPWVVALAVAGALIWGGLTYDHVRRQSWRDEAQPADTIVVFGAAEYAGRPSPVWRARLDHAYTLYERGLAPLIITTGGAGEDPRYTEGGVGRTYLMGRGVPERSLIAETQADNTDESVDRIATILRANRLRTCVAVSDGYHLFRIKQMLERQGIVVYASPRPQTHRVTQWQRFSAISREVLSYTLWRLHIT